MFRHLLTAALRNLSANRLQSGIAIIGLSIGIAAALLMALIIRNQTTYDHFIPGHERTYTVLSQFTPPGHPANYNEWTNYSVADQLKLNVPGIEAVTRLIVPEANKSGETFATLKQGEIAGKETIYFAEPNAFSVLPLPVLSGDLANALRRPDGIVIPRAIARKYFGRDDAAGRIIMLNDRPRMIGAVIEDLPVNGTELKSGIFASSAVTFSTLADAPDRFTISVYTYLRLKPGASIADVEQAMPKLFAHLLPASFSGQFTLAMPLVRLDQIPLFEGLHPGARSKVAIEALVGLLILFIAAANFVNLLTARAARRALEVGVRKVCGAVRRLLVLQFLGESILTVFFATCLALALGEWLLPSLNAFLGASAKLDYWQNPSMLGLLLSFVALLGLLAGAYPAFVLSSFRPSGVLKGVQPHAPGADLIRNALVVLQFAILIGLVVAATVSYQQNLYATREGLRGNIDQMLLMRGGCKPGFRDEVRNLPGVAGAACTDITFLAGNDEGPIGYKGQVFHIHRAFFDLGVFALYGIKPLAGSLPAASSPAFIGAAPGLVLNEAAVKLFGYASPQAAIGQAMWDGIPGGRRTPPNPSPIIAVVPDFSFQPLAAEPIAPAVYTSGANPFGNEDDVVSIRLRGQQIPETLAAIDRLWAATNPNTPITRFFLNEHMQQLYIGLLRQAQIFAVFSGVAIFLACLGLLGLSISTAERRTKEIGVRKAMGAGSGDVTRLLLWQFAKPVLWANLIAWPIAWYAMDRWLSGFAYHVTLSPLVFVGATLLAVLVALFTVAVQSTLAARAVPATALRYE